MDLGRLFTSFKKEPQRIISFQPRKIEEKGRKNPEKDKTSDEDWYAEIEPVVDLVGLNVFLTYYAEERRLFLDSKFVIVGQKLEEPKNRAFLQTSFLLL